jgi:hypothetical protein
MFYKIKPVFFVFVLLLYVSFAHAASFEVEIIPVNSRIAIDEFAKFELVIKNNNLNQKEEYRIYNPNFPTWDVRTEPLVNPITLEVEPKSEGSVELIVDPLNPINDIGIYAVSLNIRSKFSDELVSVPLKVTILSTESLIGGYVPTVVTSLGIPEKIDPREEVPIKIVLNNQNIIDYPDLIVKLESSLIKETINTQLGPKEEKTLELTAALDLLTPVQEDKLVVAVFKEDRSIINPIVRNIEIVEYAELKPVSEEKKFLLTRSRYDFVSNNAGYEGMFKVETTMLGSIFSSTSPKAKVVKENDKRFFVWDVKLENNKLEVSVTQNYIPLFVVIILLIGIIVSYYIFRSPLVIRKESANLVKKEGGVSEMTVIIHVRTRGQNKLKEIEITETVPSIVSVEREVSLGSLQPTKILGHEKKGTVVKWVIDTLDVSEERVLSYKVKSRFSILGSFSLPGATAVFKYNNKTLTSVSSRLNIGS